MIVAQWDDDPRGRDDDLRVPRDGVDDVRRHERCAVPVARLVTRGGKDELGGQKGLHGTPPAHRDNESRRTGWPESARRARTSAAVASSLLPRRIAAAASRSAAANAGSSANASMRSTSSESIAAGALRTDSSTMRMNRSARRRDAESADGTPGSTLDAPLSFPL